MQEACCLFPIAPGVSRAAICSHRTARRYKSSFGCLELALQAAASALLLLPRSPTQFALFSHFAPFQVFHFHPRGYTPASHGKPEANLIYMGRDKYENEDLIKYGLPTDVWFHVDDMSSAHVYLRLADGATMVRLLCTLTPYFMMFIIHSGFTLTTCHPCTRAWQMALPRCVDSGGLNCATRALHVQLCLHLYGVSLAHVYLRLADGASMVHG